MNKSKKHVHFLVSMGPSDGAWAQPWDYRNVVETRIGWACYTVLPEVVYLVVKVELVVGEDLIVTILEVEVEVGAVMPFVRLV